MLASSARSSPACRRYRRSNWDGLNPCWVSVHTGPVATGASELVVLEEVVDGVVEMTKLVVGITRVVEVVEELEEVVGVVEVVVEVVELLELELEVELEVVEELVGVLELDEELDEELDDELLSKELSERLSDELDDGLAETMLVPRIEEEVPVGRMLVGSVPVGSIPVGIIPVGIIPVGIIPVGRTSVPAASGTMDIGASICLTSSPGLSGPGSGLAMTLEEKAAAAMAVWLEKRMLMEIALEGGLLKSKKDYQISSVWKERQSCRAIQRLYMKFIAGL